MTATPATDEASDARTTRTDGGPEAPLRGERWLRAGERLCQRVEAAVDRLVPAGANPLTQTGALANITLLIAVASGVLLLFWYTPSIHQAHASVEAMGQAPWTAGLVRSLHRYSSDACMAFVLLHAVRLLVARRVTGARWVAWVTGLVLLVLLWVVGWLGYWLVWDERARQVALGTARVLDALPIFADPLGRSFLTDAGLNSLLFFVVFFVHMLLPLGMGVALWLHITRLSRPRFLPDRRMTAWVLGALTVASLLHPATSVAPAHMTVTPGAMTADAWYLVGVVLTDRLGAGALWALLLGAGAIALPLPWALTRARPAPAAVEASRCNGCTLCSKDCPYDAITMVPHATRAPGVPFMAQVDPAKCVACGICSGSCDSVGIGLPWLRQDLERRRVEAWLASAEGDDVAFACAEATHLEVDEASGRCAELPGYRVLRVPCAGWVHTLTVERALRRGAGKALIVACPEGSCRYREGTRWTRDRLEGRRLPVLRTDKVELARVRVVEVDRARPGALAHAAAAWRGGAPAQGGAPTGARAALGGALVAAVLTAIVVAVSEAPYAPPAMVRPELVVSFKHPGQVSEVSRRVTDAEKAATPLHMRRDVITERRRAPVRLRVSIDGAVALERAIPPSGLWGDGPSVAVERVAVAPGEHSVEVAIGDEHDEASWRHVSTRTLEVSTARRNVVRFDRTTGFTWE
jgi:coenzyme F420-reducing hydrogenase delta subunit/Pyruvate/2-oxoacid:ferredoxin oxidoreductase delta subunit